MKRLPKRIANSGDIEKNPILEYFKYIVFEKEREKLTMWIRGLEKNTTCR